MERQISRRSFLKTGAIALGTVALCDFKGIGSAVAAAREQIPGILYQGYQCQRIAENLFQNQSRI